MKRILIFVGVALLILVVMMFTCMPIPWSAWHYESVSDPPGYPSYTGFADKGIYQHLYIDDVYFVVRVLAHDETSNSGSSPYGMLVVARSPKGSVANSLIIHGVEIESSLKKKHLFKPIEVNAATRKVGGLSFPRTVNFEPVEYASGNSPYNNAAIWSETNLDFSPQEGESIKVHVDAEVVSGEVSVRKIITHEFVPQHTSGIWICQTA